MRFLMTQSLLSSWQYQWADFEKYGDRAEEFREKSWNEFLAALRREKTPTNEAIQKGIDFENLVTLIAQGKSYDQVMEVDPGKQVEIPPENPEKPKPPTRKSKTNWEKWYEAACEVAKDAQGGQFQYVGTKQINVNGLDLLLYGRLDCLKAGVIYDIKFTSGYEAGKFYTSPQHSMYMELVPEANSFIYLASNGSRVWRETYRREECRSIQDIAREFIDYLKAAELFSIYKEHWIARGQ